MRGDERVLRDRRCAGHPPLGGTILPGITRDSVCTLARDRGLAVEERRISIHELVAAHRRGELREAFGTGTAATLSHLGSLRYRDHHLQLPPVEARAIGPALRADLVAVATGRAPDRHGWLTRVAGPDREESELR